MELEMKKRLEELAEETKDLPQENRIMAKQIFMEGYALHKEQNGSFKELINTGEYGTKMQERYDFMYQQAMDYVLTGNNDDTEIMDTTDLIGGNENE